MASCLNASCVFVFILYPRSHIFRRDFHWFLGASNGLRSFHLRWNTSEIVCKLNSVSSSIKALANEIVDWVLTGICIFPRFVELFGIENDRRVFQLLSVFLSRLSRFATGVIKPIYSTILFVDIGWRRWSAMTVKILELYTIVDSCFRMYRDQSEIFFLILT